MKFSTFYYFLYSSENNNREKKINKIFSGINKTYFTENMVKNYVVGGYNKDLESITKYLKNLRLNWEIKEGATKHK